MDSKMHQAASTPEFVKRFLAEATASSTKRSLRAVVPVSARETVVDGRKCLNFSSNDYLGLAFHPALIAESVRWTEKYGAGSAASRLVTGTIDAYLELEQRIAAWKGAEAAVILGAGYMANTGLIAAIAGRKAVIFSDKYNHASLNAGCTLSGANFVRFRHNDLDHLEELIVREDDAAEKIIVCDTVFSMDGDVVDTDNLAAIAKKYGCLLYLDDAHATGVFGDRGEGLGCGASAHIVMSTFSKAMGGYGSCATCSSDMKEYLINRCGSFVFSTAMPPAIYGAISAAVDLVQGEECRILRRNLFRRVSWLREQLNAAGLNTGCSTTQILPVILGENDLALSVSRQLLENGVLAVAIRPPTVPKDTARIRLSLSAAHTDSDVEYLLEQLLLATGRK